jgi:hypothetical protein
MNAGSRDRARHHDGRWYHGLTPMAVWAWVLAVAAAFWFLVSFLIHVLLT